MWKVQKAKKLGNKYSNSFFRELLLILILLNMLAPLFSQEHQNENKVSENSANNTPKKDEAAFQELLKTATYDYNEKLYGQAIDSYQKILATANKTLSENQIQDIKLKIAHCHFELGQYYKAIIFLDPFLGINRLPTDFQASNFISPLINIQEFISAIKEPPVKGTKPITALFQELHVNEDSTEEYLIESFNKIINSSDSCKKIINAYLTSSDWKNVIIFQIPKNGSKMEQKLLARLILESLYPFNSYMNNEVPIDETKKKEESVRILKDQNYFTALYWRSRINLETSYYAFAKNGFEEILTSLNFRENEKIINCSFYKSKSKFYLDQFKVALKEFEDLNALYGLDDYYKKNYSEETYFLIGRCYFELSKFDKAIQKLLTITAGYNNREPRNKLIRNAYYWLGEAYYCKGLLNDAVKSYEVIINYGTYAEKERVYYSLGWALYDKGDRASKELAKEHLKSLLKNYPNTSYRLKTELKLVEIEIEEGHAENAEKIIADLKKSEESSEFLVKNNSSMKQIDYLFGILYSQKNEHNKALIHFKRCEDTLDLKLKQKVNIQTGLCYKALGDYKKAISYFNLASEISANEGVQILAKSYTADTYFSRRTNLLDLETAANAYEGLISLYPNHDLNIEWRKKKASALRQQNREDEAIATLSKILEEDQTEWENAQLEIGNILMTSSPQRFSAAATHFKSFMENLKNQDKKEEVSLNYGICLLKINQGLDAISVFQKLIQDSKNEIIITDAYQYLAMCYEKEKNIKESLNILETSLSKYPKQKNYVILHKECVRLYQILQDTESAIKHLKIAYVEMTEPNSRAEALYQLAGYDLKSNNATNNENGIDKLKDIVQNFSKTPIAPKAAYLLGKILTSKDNFDEALPYFEKVINEYTDTEMTTLSLIEIGNHYYLANDFNNANEYYKKINFPQNTEQEKKYDALKESVLVKKADSQFQLKEYPAAKDEYMGLIRMNRDNSFYKIRYSQSCLESKQRIADAISLLEKIPAQDQTKETEQLLERLKDLQLKMRK